jgi:hypothetical protein
LVNLYFLFFVFKKICELYGSCVTAVSPVDQLGKIKSLYNIDHICSLITTDSHKAYSNIEWMGYGQSQENHSKFQLKLSVPIERVWTLFKTLIGRTYHHIWEEKLPKYLLPKYLVEFKA